MQSDNEQAVGVPIRRTVSHFSCGAASAVATKLILGEVDRSQVIILNAFVKEEHADNRRFLADCERWFEHPITVVRNDKFHASAHEVWKRKKYMKNHFGAPCSGLLKREVLEPLFLPDDIHVYGFTVEEKKRAERFMDGGGWRFPLIERGLTKADCLAMLERAGIEMPEMYRLGFNNANCIGCIKGGEGYWNHVRKVFPAVFDEVVQIQEAIGPGAYLFRDRKTQVRFGLKDLDPNAGRHNEVMPSCSFFCEQAEEEFDQGVSL